MNAALKILIVDDDHLLREQVRQILTRQHYIVETAADGQEALDKLFETAFDAVILDIMMPKIDGLTVLKKARKAGYETPVILITARCDVKDRLKGLDFGADDYLAKPFSLVELLARVRALLGRSEGCCEAVLQIQDLVLDTINHRVTRGGESVRLNSKEYAILEFLLNNQNRVVARFSLLRHIWGDDVDPYSMPGFMDAHIKNLRHKIGDSASGDIIRTIPGVGYIVGCAAQ